NQTLPLSLIGTATTANLRYIFPAAFTVQAGATMTVDSGVNILLAGGVTLTDSGTVTFAASDTVTFSYYGTTQIVVGDGGVLNATGTTFSAASLGANTTQVDV